jgi:hypothetical protein
MKPTPQINQRSPRKQRSFPLTDHSYQMTDAVIESPATVVERKIRKPQLRSFWKISASYFGAEASLAYAAEAILFASISVVAAWPIAVLLNQLLRWMI